MRYSRSWSLIACLVLAVPSESPAQEKHASQTDFTGAEFAARRAKIYDAIGAQGIAVVQGASGVPGFSVFRQSNDFYYLCGVESAHAYLLLNGRTRTATLYLPHRDEIRERSEGKILSAEDSALVARLTGVDQVRAASDPWDGRPSREAHFVRLVKARFPQAEIALIRYIKPGVTADEVLDRAAADMTQYLVGETSRVADVQRTIGEAGVIQFRPPVAPLPVAPTRESRSVRP